VTCYPRHFGLSWDRCCSRLARPTTARLRMWQPGRWSPREPWEIHHSNLCLVSLFPRATAVAAARAPFDPAVSRAFPNVPIVPLPHIPGPGAPQLDVLVNVPPSGCDGFSVPFPMVMFENRLLRLWQKITSQLGATSNMTGVKIDKRLEWHRQGLRGHRIIKFRPTLGRHETRDPSTRQFANAHEDETKTRKAIVLTAVAIFPTGLCVLLEVIRGPNERVVCGLSSDEDEKGVGARSQRFGSVPMALGFRGLRGEGGFVRVGRANADCKKERRAGLQFSAFPYIRWVSRSIKILWDWVPRQRRRLSVSSQLKSVQGMR
jgi:hypothetical protein